MDPKNPETYYASLLQTAVDNGGQVGNNTSYVDSSSALPTSGKDVILSSLVEGNVKIEPSSRSANLNVYYRTQNGRFISKSILFGKHYASAQGAYKIPDMTSRTLLKKVEHRIVRVPVKLADGSSRMVDLYLFTKDTPIEYGKIDSAWVADGSNAWDADNKVMKLTKNQKDYATLAVGE